MLINVWIVVKRACRRLDHLHYSVGQLVIDISVCYFTYASIAYSTACMMHAIIVFYLLFFNIFLVLYQHVCNKLQ